MRFWPLTPFLRTIFFFRSSHFLKEFFIPAIPTISSPAQSVIVFHCQNLTESTCHFALQMVIYILLITKLFFLSSSPYISLQHLIPYIIFILKTLFSLTCESKGKPFLYPHPQLQAFPFSVSTQQNLPPTKISSSKTCMWL